MANLIATATGNFTAAATWKQVDSTSELDSEANSTAITTSNLDSSTFIPGAITVDAIAVKLAGRASSPSGTFTVTLWDATASSSAAAVTVNVSDLPSSGLGWALFKFSSVTLTAGHSYDVRVTCSAAGSQVTLYRDSTSNNWSRKIRTTTTQAPAANNHLVICNELTGAGTSNAITVTMDNTATTTWGPSTVGNQGVVVSCFGTLTFGTSSSTAYYFRWRGIFLICGGGTVNIGSSGGRIPTSSSVTLEMDCSSNADSRLKVDAGGDIEVYGADKTGATLLTVDAAAAATVLTVGDTTGWQNSDALGFSPTNSDTTESERQTISSVGSSTSVTLNSGLSKAKKGTGLVICNILNLTRNIKMRSVSSSLRGNVTIPAAGGTAHFEAIEFVQDTLGNGGDPNDLLNLHMTTNAVTIKKCSFNPGTLSQTTSALMVTRGNFNNLTIDSCVGFAFSAEAIYMVDATTNATPYSITNNIFINPSINNTDYFHICPGGTFTGNKILGATSGLSNCLRIGINGSDWSSLDPTLFQNLEFSMNSSNAILIDQLGGGHHGGSFYLKNAKIYRNVGWGIAVNSLRKLILDGVDFLGNGPNGSTQAPSFRISGYNGPIYMYGCTFSGDSLFTQTGAGGPTTSLWGITGDDNNNGPPVRIFMWNCSMGVATGTRVGFVSGDIDIVYPGHQLVQIIANDCSFASSTTFSNLTSSLQQELGDHIDEAGSYLRVQNYGGTAGDHRTFAPQGVLKTDSTIFHQLAPSERLTPNTASYKMRSSPKISTIGIGRTRTVSVWIRRSSISDPGGANYGGNQPRLVLRRNDSIGVTADTVLATGSVGVGTWEQLTATTPTSIATEDGAMQFYVDCDGTTGWINIDDWGII